MSAKRLYDLIRGIEVIVLDIQLGAHPTMARLATPQTAIEAIEAT